MKFVEFVPMLRRSRNGDEVVPRPNSANGDGVVPRPNSANGDGGHDVEAAVNIQEPAAAVKKTRWFTLGWWKGVRNRRLEGSPPAGAVVVQRGMRDRFILTRNSPARVNVGSREIESPTSSNNPTSVHSFRFNFQSQDKNKALIFGTLTMTMISLLSTLGDPFSNHMDRVEVKFAKAFLIFLPCVFWLECLMVAFIISLGAIWSMTGYKIFLYVSLSFALLYGITAWFAKAYAFKVLIGSNYMLNGAAFCGGYVIAVSIFVWPIIWFIVRYLIY